MVLHYLVINAKKTYVGSPSDKHMSKGYMITLFSVILFFNHASDKIARK